WPGVCLAPAHPAAAAAAVWCAAANPSPAALARRPRERLFPGGPRPQLGYQRLSGLLRGFIDLLVEHEGRYYVIGWKSNWLGPNDDAYQEEAMQRAMLDKR